MNELINKKLLKRLYLDAKQTKAYINFLKKNKTSISNLSSPGKFCNLPIMDKKNYFTTNTLPDLYPKKKIPSNAYASSGSSGKPTFWFRNTYQDFVGAEIHEYIVEEVFKIKKVEPTLVVVCFSMGLWVAGSFTASSFAQLNNKGYEISVITPGIEIKDIIAVMKNLAVNFKSIILCGYPPFLMDLAFEFEKEKISFKNKVVHAFGSGDKMTLKWKDSFNNQLKKCEAMSNSQTVCVYGSADATIMGFQTQQSGILESALHNKKILAKELLGNSFKSFNEISIYQYNPKYIYFENVGNELIISTRTASPLIRYNIHDRGIIFTFAKIKNFLDKYNLKINNNALPFVILAGRTDVSTRLYALNIYPEHISAGLQQKNISNLVSGNFLVHTERNKSHTQEKLHIDIELAKGILPQKKPLLEISKTITNALIKNNMEYRKLYASLNDKATPKIKIYKYKVKDFNKMAPSESIIGFKNKKSRVIL